jgi:hypothetical protein
MPLALSAQGTNGSIADFATDLQGGYFASDCLIDGTILGKVNEKKLQQTF